MWTTLPPATMVYTLSAEDATSPLMQAPTFRDPEASSWSPDIFHRLTKPSQPPVQA